MGHSRQRFAQTSLTTPLLILLSVEFSGLAGGSAGENSFASLSVDRNYFALRRMDQHNTKPDSRQVAPGGEKGGTSRPPFPGIPNSRRSGRELTMGKTKPHSTPPSSAVSPSDRFWDNNRFIYIRRSWVEGQFGKPKSGKERRVDLSRQLRSVLAERRDSRMLGAYLSGKSSIADEIVFPSEAGTPLDGRNVYNRYFLPAVEKAGLRHFRIHDLRHTYASLLIQAGASLAYVRDQLGHSSIQVTVDLYGHLVPSANISWVDGLDSEEMKEQSATPAQLGTAEGEGERTEVIE